MHVIIHVYMYIWKLGVGRVGVAVIYKVIYKGLQDETHFESSLGGPWCFGRCNLNREQGTFDDALANASGPC